MPSQEDRLLAVVSHVSFLVGFWLVVPIAVYAIKRKESRFVAFHALQAAMVQVLFGATMTVGAVLVVVVGVAAGLSRSPVAGVMLTAVPLLGFVGVCAALLGVHAYAAYTAWQGKSWSIPLAGSLARGILGADEGAAKA
jgi:uncharacterized Tic20 family protein